MKFDRSQWSEPDSAMPDDDMGVYISTECGLVRNMTERSPTENGILDGEKETQNYYYQSHSLRHVYHQASVLRWEGQYWTRRQHFMYGRKMFDSRWRFHDVHISYERKKMRNTCNQSCCPRTPDSYCDIFIDESATMMPACVYKI